MFVSVWHTKHPLKAIRRKCSTFDARRQCFELFRIELKYEMFYKWCLASSTHYTKVVYINFSEMQNIFRHHVITSHRSHRCSGVQKPFQMEKFQEKCYKFQITRQCAQLLWRNQRFFSQLLFSSPWMRWQSGSNNLPMEEWFKYRSLIQVVIGARAVWPWSWPVAVLSMEFVVIIQAS